MNDNTKGILEADVRPDIKDSSLRTTAGAGDPSRIKVLSYYGVQNGNSEEQNPQSIDALAFRRQLETLERWGFTSITHQDYWMYLDGQLNLPRKPIIIVFDGGYRNIYEVAFPLLTEFGMKAIICVVADATITKSHWDGESGSTSLPLLTKGQILEMHAEGFEIGSNSLTHPRLTNIPSEDAWKEISRSRISLENLLNSPVRVFSYPYGDVTPELKRMVSEAGYYAGFSRKSGPAKFGSDPFEIRQTEIISAKSTLGFAWRLLLA